MALALLVTLAAMIVLGLAIERLMLRPLVNQPNGFIACVRAAAGATLPPA